MNPTSTLEQFRGQLTEYQPRHSEVEPQMSLLDKTKMKSSAIKYISMLLAILFAMWLGKDFSYEPLIGLIGSIGALLWDDAKMVFGIEDNKTYEHDKNIYEQIVNVFNEKDIVYFLRQVNFNVSFKSQRGLDIIFISECYEPPEYGIWDKKLEKLRKKLFVSIDELAHMIAMCTYSIHNDRHTAIPDLYRGGFEPPPDHVQENIDKMHKLANQVIEDYSAFYQAGGMKFNINV